MADYNLERLNFLIADDNKHMRAMVKSLLLALGVRNVVEASDGADAFKELRHFPADIIICDWSMKPVDGLAFTRMVRSGKDSPNPFVPIIMLTGFTEMTRVVEARDTGIHEFLAKPISAKALYSRFASIIENPRPFIRTKTYFGPDRRRQNLGPPRGIPERRKEEIEKMAEGAAADGLSQQEIESLLDKYGKAGRKTGSTWKMKRNSSSPPTR